MEELRKQIVTLKGWLGFRSFRMRLVLMVWVTFRGMTIHVFQQSHAMAAESRKVPLEIFFNPTILSDEGWPLIFSHLLRDYELSRIFQEFFEFFLTNCKDYINFIVFVLVFTKMGYLSGSSFFYALLGNCNS